MTLLDLLLAAVQSGVAPTDDEIAAVIDQPAPDRASSRTPGGPQLPAVRKRLAIDIAQLLTMSKAAAKSAAHDLAEEYARYASQPGDLGGADDHDTPAALAAHVPRIDQAVVVGVNGGKPDTPQARTVATLAPLRELLTDALHDGPPDQAALDELSTSLTGTRLRRWQRQVSAACRDIRDTFAAGRQGEARQKVDQYLDQLGDAMTAAEPERDDDMDPTSLASKVSRGHGGRSQPSGVVPAPAGR